MASNVEKLPVENQRVEKKKRQQPDWDQIRGLYQQGVSVRAIADMEIAQGRSFQAIDQYAKRHGWSRDTGAQANVDARTRVLEEEVQKIDKKKRITSEDVYAKDVDIKKTVLQRQKSRLEKLHEDWDFLSMVIELKRAGDERANDFVNYKESVFDLVTKQTNIAKTITELETNIHRLNADSNKEIKPFVPVLQRRGTPTEGGS